MTEKGLNPQAKIERLESINAKLLVALIESHALNVNWVSVAETDMLEHLSEYKIVIQQVEAAIANAENRQGEPYAAKLIGEITRQFYAPLVRGLDRIADANGGQGEQWEAAKEALIAFADALFEMRKGKQ